MAKITVTPLPRYGVTLVDGRTVYCNSPGEVVKAFKADVRESVRRNDPVELDTSRMRGVDELTVRGQYMILLREKSDEAASS